MTHKIRVMSQQFSSIKIKEYTNKYKEYVLK